MQVNRTKSILRNVSTSLLNKSISLILPFLIRTLMIQKLGVEYIGLNGLFSSILQMLSLTELGFGSAMVFSMYKPVAEEDTELVCALLNFYKKIYRIIGFLIIGFGLILMPNIAKFIASDYPKDINIYIIYAIYLANTIVSYFLFAYKSSILVACLRSDIENSITSICNLLMYLLQIFVLIFWSNYYTYIILLPIFTVVNNIIRAIIVNKMFPQYEECGELSRENKKDINSRVGALVGHRIGGVVFSSVDNMIISSFLGLAILGQYSNYIYIYTAINGIISIVFQSILAIIGNTIAVKTADENYRIFKEMFLINAWQSCFCTSCFLCLYQPFMKLWVGDKNLLPFIIPFLLSIYYFVANIRRVCTGYKDAAGMWKDDFWKPYVSVLLNLVLNIVSVKIIGLSGIIISSIAAIVFVEIPWETKVLFDRYFHMNARIYYKRFLQTASVCAISMLITYLVCGVILDGILGFILKLISCVVISNAIFIVVFFRTEEFKDAFNRLLFFFKKGKKYESSRNHSGSL